jgi:Protein of unknown function (DUF3572)
MQRNTRISRVTQEEAETIAIAALGFLASDPDRLGRFLAMTGLGPENLRAAASDPGFLGQVLAHVAEDESLLLAFAANSGERPERVGAAHITLGGSPDERQVPWT